jgi:hypothetical protein
MNETAVSECGNKVTICNIVVMRQPHHLKKLTNRSEFVSFIWWPMLEEWETFILGLWIRRLVCGTFGLDTWLGKGSTPQYWRLVEQAPSCLRIKSDGHYSSFSSSNWPTQ